MERDTFDLEAAKRGDPIMCANGVHARFVAHFPDLPKDGRVIAVIGQGSGEHVVHRREDGRVDHDLGNGYSLVMAPKLPLVRYILVDRGGKHVVAFLFDSEEHATAYAEKYLSEQYHTCIRIEVPQ